MRKRGFPVALAAIGFQEGRWSFRRDGSLEPRARGDCHPAFPDDRLHLKDTLTNLARRLEERIGSSRGAVGAPVSVLSPRAFAIGGQWPTGRNGEVSFGAPVRVRTGRARRTVGWLREPCRRRCASPRRAG